MTISALSLPVDIPWKRLCVSADMIDEKVCDRVFPYRWRSSVAIFSYEPPDEHQTYENMIVSYLKVACTITGLQVGDEIRQQLGIPPDTKITPFSDTSVTQLGIDSLNEYYGCYGAILEVSLKPTGSAASDKSKYPYFMDFEPKKREVYELVSETGEVMSRSLSGIKVQKGMTTTQSHEVLDVFKGGSLEAKGPGGAGAGISVQGEWGTKDVTQQEYSNLRSSDQSREMRELFSHTTQLTQMYHQFTSYHLGTNRAVFFVLPRPHIVQTEHTFVNGPRELEGIQEVFLVVMRPKEVQEFCVEAYLETAHIAWEKQHGRSEKLVHLQASFPQDPKAAGYGPPDATAYNIDYHSWDYTATYTAPPGLEIDVDRNGAEVKAVQTVPSEIDSPGSKMNKAPVQYTAPEVVMGTELNQVSVTGKVGPQFVRDQEFPDDTVIRACLPPLSVKIDLLVFLRKSGLVPTEVPATLFITGRGVCCCPPERVSVRPIGTAVLIERTRPEWSNLGITAGTMLVKQANRLRAEIGTAMLQSVNDPHRYPRDTVSMLETQFLSRRIANKIGLPGHPDNQLVQDIDGVRSDVRDRIVATMPRLRRADVLRMQLQETMDRFGLTHQEAVHLRRAAFGLEQGPLDPKDRWDPPRSRVKHKVPNLAGIPLKEARLLLEEEELLIGELAYQDSEQPKDIALSQSPAAGEEVNRGTEINLVLATGLSVLIPDVVGKPLTDALCMLHDAGLRSSPDLEFSSRREHPRHTVIEITPKARTYITPNARVVLEVARS
ncbi:PASTA domain-containing protein [Taklimakanibacter deserti]|uniref:PASTA domain-containing protein n=1 Tax=Taklimakanibacter deserti TaxID=2267839 RepID=UPI000E659640